MEKETEKGPKKGPYSIFLYRLNENNKFYFLNKFIIFKIEDKTIEFLKDFISFFYQNNCLCKFKIFECYEDGYIYSDFNDSPNKKIKECFEDKTIFMLRSDKEECKCNLEYKELFKYSRREMFDKFIEIKNELKNISSLNNKLLSKIKESENVINKFQILLKEKEKIINSLKNQLDQIKNNIKETEILNNDLLILYTIQKEEHNKKIGISQNQKTESSYPKHKSVKSQMNLMKDVSLKNLIEKDEKNCKFYSNKKADDFYDVIIAIQSVKDINKGWQIKMNERGKKNYELYKNKEILKIGVIGNANKGKSYILSRISKIDLPSGTSIRTEGLSIKYPELERFKHRKIALLDSAGLETPVLRENEESEEISKELFREKSREKLITELFLQNYIIHNSDILILVVGILTYSEQKLLNRIKTEIQRTKLNKPLYIIHNLKTYVENQQVEEYINKFLLKSATFKLVQGHKASTEVNDDDEDLGIYYYEKNSNPKIFHLIFANEFSDAGKYYNNYTLEFLENAFQQQVTDLKPFDVIQNIKERFIEISKEIIEKTETQNPLKIEDFEDNNNCLKLKNEQNITLKKCMFIDELGFSTLKGNGFEPNYNYYQKDDHFIIRLEAPGNCNLTPSINYVGEYTIIRLKGNKKKDTEPEKLEDNIHNTREFGDFTLYIPLKTEDFIVVNEKPTIAEKKGVLMVKYKFKKIKDVGRFKVKEEDEI